MRRLAWVVIASISLGLAASSAWAALPPVDPPPPVDPQPEPPDPTDPPGDPCCCDCCHPPQHTPEPTSLSLLLIGAGICGYRAWRRGPTQ